MTHLSVESQTKVCLKTKKRFSFEITTNSRHSKQNIKTKRKRTCFQSKIKSNKKKFFIQKPVQSV